MNLNSKEVLYWVLIILGIFTVFSFVNSIIYFARFDFSSTDELIARLVKPFFWCLVFIYMKSKYNKLIKKKYPDMDIQ